MLTPATTVDAARRAAVMWSISQIAERDSVSKQAVSKRVQRLISSGLAVERDGQGRVSAVNVAQYDHLSGQYRDPTKDQRPAQPTRDDDSRDGGDPVNASLEEATRQKAWLSAERERIALAEAKGELVSRADEVDALIHVGAEVARIIDRAVNWADEIATAVGRDGPHGARVVLKRLLATMRNDIADSLAKVASEAPDTDGAVSVGGGDQQSLNGIAA